MKAILLCAGQGKRLLPLTEDRPKCLVEVAGVTILERQIRALAMAGIDEIVVATGFRDDQIIAALQALDPPLPPLRVSFNPFYAVSDNLATCWLLRHEMHGPFLIINGDTLFETEIARRVLAMPDDVSIRVTVNRKPAYDDDDMKVVLDGDRLCAIGKQPFASIDAESIGMLRFDARGGALFRQTLETMMHESEGNARWYLSAIDRIANTATDAVGVCDITGLHWCEIDTPGDLATAAERLGVPALPAERARGRGVA
ncbi:MAG: phosphocholine cytidylyltransferase family protein [Wenzhouxiangellaceae bacterium]|nr:phosphocholine cytidylyltransferase family protein [Wenzhouxiangellaceae bacterium]